VLTNKAATIGPQYHDMPLPNSGQHLSSGDCLDDKREGRLSELFCAVLPRVRVGSGAVNKWVSVEVST